METKYRNKRVDIFHKCLENFQKEIVDQDVVTISSLSENESTPTGNNDVTTSINGDDSGHGDNQQNNSIKYQDDDREDLLVVIPKPGIPFNPTTLPSSTVGTIPSHQVRQVTGTCAICLSAYCKGETIVWSSYSECTHAFHFSCIDTWVKKRYTSSCPCCRRDFIDSEVYTKMKLKMKC